MHANEHPGTKDHHEYSREEGYKPADYEHQEYPKHIVVNGETVTVNSAEEEKAALESEAAQSKPETKAPRLSDFDGE